MTPVDSVWDGRLDAVLLGTVLNPWTGGMGPFGCRW